jgi:hypothetical protein
MLTIAKYYAAALFLTAAGFAWVCTGPGSIPDVLARFPSGSGPNRGDPEPDARMAASIGHRRGFGLLPSLPVLEKALSNHAFRDVLRFEKHSGPLRLAQVWQSYRSNANASGS